MIKFGGMGVVFALLYGLSATTNADEFSQCSQVFYLKYPPINSNKNLSTGTKQLCYTGFAVLHSSKLKTPMWSAEFITPDSLAKAKTVKRIDSFHEESKLSSSERAKLADYKGSGFDRGHLAPSGNRYSRVDQQQSFSLANIIPQAPDNNQNQWREAEEATRAYVTKNKEPMYIITGGLYLKGSRKIGSGISVPTHIYKVILLPKSGVVGAYVSVNDNNARIDSVSVSQLQQYAGIVFFPTLNKTQAITTRYNLPFTANQAYKLKEISINNDPLSDIFSQSPSKDALPKQVKQTNTSKAKGFVIDKFSKYDKQSIQKEIKMIQSIL